MFGITDNNEIVGLQDPENDAEYSGSVISLNDNGEAFIKRNAKKIWQKLLIQEKKCQNMWNVVIMKR